MSADQTPRLQFNWQPFVVKAGDAGRAWVAEFNSGSHLELFACSNRALLLLRGGEPLSALALLQSMAARMAELSDTRASIVHVLERLYHGVMGYHYYTIREYDEAQAQMDKADLSVRRALSADRILMPLAHDCQEFQLHHARIELRRGRIDEMRRRIQVVREMVECTRPLCELEDGTRIDYDMLASYYRALPLSGEEQRDLEPVLQSKVRRQRFDWYIMYLYQVPGFVIPYR